MKHIYLAPTALIESSEIGACDVHPCPGLPGSSLLIVLQWVSDLAQDRFEADPRVTEMPSDRDKPAPAALVTAFTDGKVASLSSVDTVGSAFWKLRAMGIDVRS